IDRRMPGLLRERAAAAAAMLPTRAGRLQHVLAAEPLADRHVDWVTEGRRAIRPSLYGPRLREHVRRTPAINLPGNGSANGSVPGALMRLDQQHWLPGDVLAKADRASMQISLELRTPYLQRELAELAATVPPSVHVRSGGKLVVRRLLERVLPDASHRRSKVAFRTPTADWLRGPLAPALRAQLEESTLYADGWFERDAVRRLADEHASGARDWTKVLWPIFALGTWLDASEAR